MRRLTLRLVLFAFALLLLLAPLALLFRAFTQRPAVPAAPAGQAQPSTGIDDGLQRTLLGVYLGVRDSDLKRPAGSDPSPVTFVVHQGDSADTIGQDLLAAGLISDAELFGQLVRYEGVGERLQAGEYVLRATMSLEEIVAALQISLAKQLQVTLREGWRFEQMAEEISFSGAWTYDAVLQAIRGGAYTYSILGDRPSGIDLEGYLFPDTYQLDPRWQPGQIIDLLVATMDKRFTPAMRQQGLTLGLNAHQVLTLASLVEREAQVPSERSLIAGVLLNRLSKKMPLEVDASVQYALGYDKAQKRWWPQISADQLRQSTSAWNTYTRTGLPPGPICAPGLSTIQAVLQPTKTDYLFYLAKGDGSHVFAKTFEEHLENQKKYQK